MRRSRLRQQDGFIREILWVALVIAVIAVLLLDGMAIFAAYREASDAAKTAAAEARATYTESQDVRSAELAAKTYLVKSGDKLVAFETGRAMEGGYSFTVTARTHADTYVFKFLRYVPGLKAWVKSVTDPTSTETAQ